MKAMHGQVHVKLMLKGNEKNHTTQHIATEVSKTVASMDARLQT